MRRGLAFLIGLVLVCDLAVVGVHLLDENTTLVSGDAGPVDTRERRVLPGPGQAFLTGDVERLVADNAHGKTLESPFTITAVERGVGRLSIEKALVNGRRVTISWDGGTPLPISGEGGLDLGPTHVEIDKEGVAWSLDGAGRTFVPGTYDVGAPVAVGAQGIATPQEGVEFTADAETVLVARGGVVVRIEIGDGDGVELEGPGKLEVSGNLEVQFPDRRSDTSSIRFGEGPFRLTVDLEGDKLKLDAVLQGQVDTG